MKIEVWCSEDQHYYEYETDDISINGIPLEEKFVDVYRNAIDDFIKEIQNKPLVNYFQMLELMDIAKKLKE